MNDNIDIRDSITEQVREIPVFLETEPPEDAPSPGQYEPISQNDIDQFVNCTLKALSGTVTPKLRDWRAVPLSGGAWLVRRSGKINDFLLVRQKQSTDALSPALQWRTPETFEITDMRFSFEKDKTMPPKVTDSLVAKYVPTAEEDPVDSCVNFLIRLRLLPLSLEESEQLDLRFLYKLMDLGMINKINYPTPAFSYKPILKNKYHELRAEMERESPQTAIDDKKDVGEKELANAVRSLLSSDTIRADITSEQEGRLQDPNGGLWELWDRLHSSKREAVRSIPAREPVYARNPRADVDENRIIGIDFGTKSTVVACQESSGEVELVRVGARNYEQAAKEEDYENPTVIQFIDLARFRRDYEAFAGRPNTRWEDAWVSHAAYDSRANLSGQDGPLYSASYFGELKQWASDSRFTVRIRDRKSVENKGTDIELPRYDILKETDIDPIAYYAYYLGLYINNMPRGKIALRYLMSFPVGFTKATRERILNSFSRGLLKSLPQSMVEDRDYIREHFSVQQSKAAEPTAYAACALRSYRIRPADNEQILYSVFDFGGGTSDFDFGIWHRESQKRRGRNTRYMIECCARGGDDTLGGENLLQELSYEVFWDNENELRKEKIQFLRPSWHSTSPRGYEALEAKTLEAQTNMRTLQEAMRQIWEIKRKEPSRNSAEESEPAGEQYEPVREPSLKITEHVLKNIVLFTKDGEQKSMDLNVNEEKLRGMLKKRLTEGVSSFCEMLGEFIRGRMEEQQQTPEAPKITEICVFLAGNSSRSVLFQEIMESQLKLMNSGLIKEYGALGSDAGRDDGPCRIYYPLGTPQAQERIQMIQEEFGDETRRMTVNGKTGVAAGIIYTREGGSIKVIDRVVAYSSEIPFPYFCGEYDEDAHALYPCVKDTSHYNVWTEYMDAAEANVELSYAASQAVIRKSGEDGYFVRFRKREILAIPNELITENNVIVLRPKDPATLEWAVAPSLQEANKGIFLSDPRELKLN